MKRGRRQIGVARGKAPKKLFAGNIEEAELDLCTERCRASPIIIALAPTKKTELKDDIDP